MPARTRSTPELVSAFLTAKRVGGCSPSTLKIYQGWLAKFALAAPTTTSLDALRVTTFLSRVREGRLKPISVHQCFRTVRTFVRWCCALGVLKTHPMTTITMKMPRTLPTVPTEDELRALLGACRNTVTGRRHRAMILTMLDAGLRQGEVRRLLIEHVDLTTRTLIVRGGKGGKDRVAGLSAITVRAIKAWMQTHPAPAPENFVFVSVHNTPIPDRGLIRALHQLSARADLAPHRRISPHRLRHAAATSWLRNGMGLDQCRRRLGHSSLDMTLRYSSLLPTDVPDAHRKAGAVERMGLE